MKNYQIEIKWAFLFAFMGLLWMLLEKLSGLHSTHIDKHTIYTNFVAIPAIAIYVFALLDKKKNFYHGTITYKQAFMTGAIITLIVTLLSPLTQIITSTLITPEYFPNVINYAVSSGQMTQVDAENYFNLKNYVVQSIFGAVIMGLITTAIVAFFVKSKATPIG
jgi:hypothetical protein